jgi:hypothetical protein
MPRQRRGRQATGAAMKPDELTSVVVDITALASAEIYN